MAHTKVLIIGSGPAGYTAAIYASRANLQPILLAGTEIGGQLGQTTEVENFPGFPQGIQGPELMESMRQQAIRFGTIIENVSATKVDFSKRPLVVWADQQEFTADSVIIATGASAKYLGLPNEQRLRGHGVSACATCDGFFFKGKDVAVVGGGDTAMEEALFLTKFATSVTVIVRSEELRASTFMQNKAKENKKIQWRWNSEVIDVLGESTVTGLKLRNTKDQSESEISVGGLFLAIGHAPNTHFLHEQLPLVGPGYLKVTNQVFSDIPGVFISGDVADYRYRQAITAAGWGCMAALEAEKYLTHGQEPS